MKKFFIILLFLIFPIFVLAKQIDINSASLTQLDELAGIGPAYAQRIIDGRPYSSVDDLDRVKGIGPATLQKIKNQGFACVNCQTTQEVVPKNEEQTPTPIAEIIYSSGIFINEILPNPKGADGTDEWIELFNSNNFDVDLSGWKISDKTGTVVNYEISKGVKILANNFLVFKRPETKIMLNNDGDGVNLITPDEKIIDSADFVSAPLGQSYNKTTSSWKWSLTLTPGLINVISVPQVKTSNKSLPKTQKSDNNKIDLTTADLSQALANQDTKSKNPWFLFFIALAVTLILAAVVLFIKLKLKRDTNNANAHTNDTNY